MQLIVSGSIAALFALIHVAGFRLTFLRVTPRSIWLSLAGGISVAYVFIHLLPELAEFQEAIGGHLDAAGFLKGLERHSYLIALIGLATFYGLDRAAQTSARASGTEEDGRPSVRVFWIHLGAFAVYNFLIGYLLVHREEGDLISLLVYGFAMAVHFMVNDHALREQHGDVYDSTGRWLLAAAPLAGWALGLSTDVSPVFISAVFAFLAGGVVMNVLKEELPEDRESRFWAFALGSGAYAVLLLAAG
ncbi:MAG TPA: hypothetical protein VGR19_07420 [Allosphingosinicella sp.]|nr:hypothetical protein [Allosphingosinicella sp.]